MKKVIFLFLVSFCSGIQFLNAQIPVLKVDFNVDGSRQLAEVNEPGYNSWRISESPNSITLEGVTFTLMNGTVNDSWHKASVQAPNYARLVGDGIVTESVDLQIEGLPLGKHSLVTFHNNFDNPDNNVFSNIDIYLGREKVYTDLESTTRVHANDLATTAYIEFEVTDNSPVVIRFVSAPKANTTKVEIPICGFHLNSSDPKKMARSEYPSDKDEHVDIDNDTLVMNWVGPSEAASYNFYFGKEKTDVQLASVDSAQYIANLTDTFYFQTGFYNMDNYYWRVDPIDSKGDTTKGDVWYFKKRMRAFPEAEGYGGYAIGGRGGKVVYVTNLNPDGPDSFTDAVENADGPTTILFAVSGLITLNDRLVINKDYITVAGQSAPGKGVCFRWAPIGVTGDNLIVQNVRVRMGIGITYDGMGLSGAEHSIIDHCSISWTIDEAFSSRNAKNMTLQRTLISEALNVAGHSNYPEGTAHGYAGSIGGDIGSFHHNLLAHCEGRNWSLAGGLDGDSYYAGRLDIFNNVVYNWGGRATDGGAHEVNFVGNYYKMGPATSQNTILKAQLEGTGLGSQSYYYDHNIVENTSGTLMCDGTDNTCSQTYVTSGGQIVDWEVFVNEPFFPSLATIHGPQEAYKRILSDVGCTQPAFDDHDIRIINETINGTTSLVGSKTNKPGLPDHENDAGNWEVYPGYLRSVDWDTDMDGLPNWWEETKGLNSTSAEGDFSESNADDDKNGYTNLEEYLHWMDRPHFFLENEENIDINLSAYTRGFTNKPEFQIVNSVNGSATIQSGTSIVNFTPDANGICEFEFKVSDAEGTAMYQKIGVFKGQIPSDSLFSYSYNLNREGSIVVNVDTVNSYDTLYSEIETDTWDASSIKDIIVYPNPAQNRLHISIEASTNTVTELEIFDAMGKTWKKNMYIINSGKNEMGIDISELSSGIYFLMVNSQDSAKKYRFMKL